MENFQKLDKLFSLEKKSPQKDKNVFNFKKPEFK